MFPMAGSGDLCAVLQKTANTWNDQSGNRIAHTDIVSLQNITERD